MTRMKKNHKTTKTNIPERLEHLLACLEIKSPSRLAAMTPSLAGSTLGNWIKGFDIPKFETALSFCNHWAIRGEWLLFGTGPMGAPGTGFYRTLNTYRGSQKNVVDSDDIFAKRIRIAVEDLEQWKEGAPPSPAVVAKIGLELGLSSSEIEELQESARVAREERVTVKETPADPPLGRTVYILSFTSGIAASTIGRKIIVGEQDSVEVPLSRLEQLKASEDLIALRVDTRALSMTPTYIPEDYVIVDRNKGASSSSFLNGYCYAVRLDEDSVAIKRVYRRGKKSYVLVSDNEDQESYPEIPINGLLGDFIIGQVLDKIPAPQQGKKRQQQKQPQKRKR